MTTAVARTVPRFPLAGTTGSVPLPLRATGGTGWGPGFVGGGLRLLTCGQSARVALPIRFGVGR